MERNIQIYRTPMGDIIGTLEKVEEQVYFLKDVLSLQITQGEQGINVGFGSVAPFSKGATDTSPQIDIEMPYTNVLFAYHPNEDLEKGYVDIIEDNRIITPDNKIIT